VLPETSIVLKPMTSVSSGAIASAVAEVGGVILDLIFIPLPHRTLL